MSTRNYSNGQLTEEWDDITRTYRRWVNGVLVETRAYTSAEIAAIRGHNGITYGEDEVFMLDHDGSIIFRLGTQQFGDRGVAVFREDATAALTVRKELSNGSQALTMFDGSGNVIFREGLFASGHEEPYLHVPFQPVAAAGGSALTCGPHGIERSTTSGTFVSLYRAQFRRENPFQSFEFAVNLSDTTTAAEIQVINETNGASLAGFLQTGWLGVVAAGTSGWRTVAPPYSLGTSYQWAYGQTAKIAVQARRTAGAGTVTVSVRHSSGGNA